MGKQGFNLPFMKNTFDWNHMSSLAKRQIMGRPARQYRNPRKNFRLEGATFVDTVTYIGSEDPKQDKIFRNAALRSAVTAPEIIGGTYVLGPGIGTRSAGMKGPRLELDDDTIQVESYVTLEEVRTIHAERQDLIDQLWSQNPLTMELVTQTIDAYREKNNGENPLASMKMIEDGPLAGRLSWSSLNGALKTGSHGLASDPIWRSLNRKWQSHDADTDTSADPEPA